MTNAHTKTKKKKNQKLIVYKEFQRNQHFGI